MNKNKKLIKFQRKQILISNPLNSQPTQQKQQKQPKATKQQSSTPQIPNYPSLNIMPNDTLQYPKQMKLENIAHRYKSKFIAMMDADPLIKIDTLFQNQTVCLITGNVPKNNRQSFGKKNKQKQTKNICEQTHLQFQKISPLYTNHNIWTQQQPNYLQLLSQGLPNQHMSLNQAFQFQNSYQAQVQHHPQPRYNILNSNLPFNNGSHFGKKQFDKYL